MGGFPERRGVHRCPGGLLGGRGLGAAEPGADQGDRLECLDPQVGKLAALLVDPAGLQAGQQAAVGDGHRLLSRVPAGPPGAGVDRRARTREALAGGLPVDPGVARQLESKLAAAVETARSERLAQPREGRGEQSLAAAGGAVLGPECLDQLVAPHGPVAMQSQICEQQPSLAPWQASFQLLAFPDDG
jgi:hypothetical protein